MEKELVRMPVHSGGSRLCNLVPRGRGIIEYKGLHPSHLTPEDFLLGGYIQGDPHRPRDKCLVENNGRALSIVGHLGTEDLYVSSTDRRPLG